MTRRWLSIAACLFLAGCSARESASPVPAQVMVATRATATESQRPVEATPPATSTRQTPTLAPLMPTLSPASATASPAPTLPPPAPTLPPATPTASPAQVATASAPELTTAVEPTVARTAPAAPRAYETTLQVATYDYEAGFVPTTADDAVFPYPRLDFSRVGPPTARSYRAVVLENEYVSLTVLPELGGRLYRWVDKTSGRRLLYENLVVKPTSWGYRGWWLAAGGMEWSFPVEEHGLNEWRPWQVRYDATSITVWDVEDRTGLEVGVTLSLDAEHAYLTIRPWVANRTTSPQTYQFWLNAMLALGNNRVSPETQLVLPTTAVTVHSTGDETLPNPGEQMAWPVHNSRAMDRYGNWSDYLGFFVTGAPFVAVYDPEVNQGIVRVPGAPPPGGTKIFGPATLSPSLWTDDDSHYLELWSGATSSFWEEAVLGPGERAGWVEHWYPVPALGGVSYANERAALYLKESAGDVTVALAVTRATIGTVHLTRAGRSLATWPLLLSPGELFRVRVEDVGGEGSLALRLEDEAGAVLAGVAQ